jgi:P27 family predicted phage terminase small subunit
VTKELAQLGLLTGIDRAVLVMYCQAWSRWVEAEQHLVDLGPERWTFSTDNGYQAPSPWLGIANAAAKEVRRLAVEFGMTPSSRSRVTVSKQEEQDPYEAFRRQRNGTSG